MADQFTEQEVSNFKDTFDFYDREYDGTIDGKDLGTLLRALGQNPTEGELTDLRNDISSKDGRIEFSDFLVLLARQMKNSSDEEELLEAFRMFDKKGNGCIPLEELRYILMTLGEQLDGNAVNQILKEVELNSKGEINYEELIRTNMSSK